MATKQRGRLRRDGATIAWYRGHCELLTLNQWMKPPILLSEPGSGGARREQAVSATP